MGHPRDRWGGTSVGTSGSTGQGVVLYLPQETQADHFLCLQSEGRKMLCLLRQLDGKVLSFLRSAQNEHA